MIRKTITRIGERSFFRLKFAEVVFLQTLLLRKQLCISWTKLRAWTGWMTLNSSNLQLYCKGVKQEYGAIKLDYGVFLSTRPFIRVYLHIVNFGHGHEFCILLILSVLICCTHCEVFDFVANCLKVATASVHDTI